MRFFELFAIAGLVGCLAGTNIYAEEVEDLDALFDDVGTTATTMVKEALGTVTAALKNQTTQTTVSISGEHQFEFHAPVIKDHLGFDSYLKAPKIVNEIGVEIEKGDLKIVSAWNADLLVYSGGDQNTLLETTPGENFVQLSTPACKFIFGYQQFGWGSADKLNPTNNLNPKDYAGDIFKYETLPLLAMRAVYYPSDTFSLEAVYAPYEQATSFPIDVAAQIPPELFFQTEISKAEIPYTLESGVAAVRVSMYSALDMALSYTYDFDDYYTPVIRYVSPFDKSLTLVKDRIHRIGWDMKTTVDRFGLWLEACYSLTRDAEMNLYDKRNPYLDWTFGLDFNYGPEDRFYLNFQYTGTYVFDYDDQFFKDYEQGQPDPVQLMMDQEYGRTYYTRALLYRIANQSENQLHGFQLKTEWPLADSKVVPSVVGAYYLPVGYDQEEKTRYGSLLFNPELLYKPMDDVEIALGSYLIYAWHKPTGSDTMDIDWTDRLGMMHDDSNIYLEIRYSWAQDIH
jgi:hypothetical protein